MKKEVFLSLIEKINFVDDRNNILYRNGIDSLEFSDKYHEIISMLGELYFGEQAWDWIQYYLYELSMMDDVDFVTIDDTKFYLRNPNELYEFLKSQKYV